MALWEGSMKWCSDILLVPQAEHHDDALIIGDLDALTALRDAIDRAIESGQSMVRPVAMSPDGEGYELVVIKLPTEDVRSLPTTYTAYYLRTGRSVYENQNVVHAMNVLEQFTGAE